MSKRNALRIGNPHSPESISYAVDRYGPIKPETLSEITDWLKQHENEYAWSVGYETIDDGGVRNEIVDGGILTPEAHPIIKTQRKGSAIEKIIDNEHDAQNTLANIRNINFPKNKQGQ